MGSKTTDMKDGMFVNNDKERADYWFHVANRYMDFLEWLFDTELEYTNESEMWRIFETWEDHRDGRVAVVKKVSV